MISSLLCVVFIAFFDYNYKLRKLKTNYERISSIFTALKHRFLKKRDNVTSVFYFLNKINIFLTSHFFNIIRLNLAYLNKDIYIYINVFFYIYNFFSLSYLVYIHLYNLALY